MKQKKAYHHGDLRQALLQAAMAMIDESGLEQLSLRKVAARVGVSHAAPEHHFPTMRHLLTAMATEGFRLFYQSIETELVASDPDPGEQIRAAQRGYLRHARSHPALFRLMFNAGVLDWTDASLCEASGAAYAQLLRVCAPAADFRGLKTEAERDGLAHLVWSQVHGQAHLMIDQKLPDPGEEECPPRSQPMDLVALLFGG